MTDQENVNESSVSINENTQQRPYRNRGAERRTIAPEQKTFSTLQSIVYRDRFVFSKKNNFRGDVFSTVVTPFEISERLKYDGLKYSSNLVFPQSLLHRIENIRDHIKTIFSYTMLPDDTINVNCLNTIPQEVFQDIDRGFVHFTYRTNVKDGVLTTEIDDKGIWELVDNEPEAIVYEQKDVKFVTETFKVFPVLLTKGFIFGTVTPSTASVYVTMMNAEKLSVGLLADRYQVNNLMKNIFPAFPSLFGVSITSQVASVFLKNAPPALKKALVAQGRKELILKFTYNFKSTKKIKCEIIAQGLEKLEPEKH